MAPAREIDQLNSKDEPSRRVWLIGDAVEKPITAALYSMGRLASIYQHALPLFEQALLQWTNSLVCTTHYYSVISAVLATVGDGKKHRQHYYM